MIVSKWKYEICEKEFENFHAQGFEHKIYCPLCFFKEKTNRLEKENSRLKDKIEKAFKIVDDKLTNLNLEFGVNNEFREEYDKRYKVKKDD